MGELCPAHCCVSATDAPQPLEVADVGMSQVLERHQGQLHALKERLVVAPHDVVGVQRSAIAGAEDQVVIMIGFPENRLRSGLLPPDRIEHIEHFRPRHQAAARWAQ